MRDLSQIITRRALEVIREANQRSERRIDEGVAADRMAELMGADRHSVRKQLRRYLRHGHIWRADYVESFAQAFGVPIERLVSLDGRESVSEATRGQMLWTGLGRRLTPTESRRAVRLAHRALDDRPRLGISLDVIEAIVSARSRQEALAEVSALILAAKDLDATPRILAGTKKTGKKSR